MKKIIRTPTFRGSYYLRLVPLRKRTKNRSKSFFFVGEEYGYERTMSGNTADTGAGKNRCAPLSSFVLPRPIRSKEREKARVETKRTQFCRYIRHVEFLFFGEKTSFSLICCGYMLRIPEKFRIGIDFLNAID